MQYIDAKYIRIGPPYTFNGMHTSVLDVAISHVSNDSHVCLPLIWINLSNFALILKDRQKGFLCPIFYFLHCRKMMHPGWKSVASLLVKSIHQ